MEAAPGSDDDSAPLSPSAARSLDGDVDLEAGVRPAPVPPRRNRYGLVLWGLAGLEERPERHVVLSPRLTALLAPGPRGLARADDGRAGLYLLVLSIRETRRVATHNLTCS